MKLLQFIILSAVFTIILNACIGSIIAKNKDECFGLKSSKKNRLEEWKCCWREYRYRAEENAEWTEIATCEDTPYDGDIISLRIKKREAEINFQHGEIGTLSIDCSSKWIHSFFGLVLLLAFLL